MAIIVEPYNGVALLQDCAAGTFVRIIKEGCDGIVLDRPPKTDITHGHILLVDSNRLQYRRFDDAVGVLTYANSDIRFDVDPATMEFTASITSERHGSLLLRGTTLLMVLSDGPTSWRYLDVSKGEFVAKPTLDECAGFLKWTLYREIGSSAQTKEVVIRAHGSEAGEAAQ